MCGKLQIVAATKEQTKKPICIVTYNEIQAKNIIKDLKFLVEDEKIVYFPKREIVTYDYFAESKDLPYERIDVLNKIQNAEVSIIVTTIEAIMQKMISKKTLYANVFKIKVGDIYSLEKIKEKLILLGYERNDIIEGRGQFSIRGRNCRYCYV